jgi:hypothetical protein
MLLPLIVKLFTRLSDVFVTTAPAKPPKVGAMLRYVSILLEVVPFVVPSEMTLTARGYETFEIAPLKRFPAPSYHVGVIVNAAVPGSTSTPMGCGTASGLVAQTPAVTVPHRAERDAELQPPLG